MADLLPSTDEEIPNASAATTSAMAPDAITDFVLLNRSDFIYSSFFTMMGEPTEGPQVPPPEIPRWPHPVVSRATRVNPVTRPSDRVELMGANRKPALHPSRVCQLAASVNVTVAS